MYNNIYTEKIQYIKPKRLRIYIRICIINRNILEINILKQETNIN